MKTCIAIIFMLFIIVHCTAQVKIQKSYIDDFLEMKGHSQSNENVQNSADTGAIEIQKAYQRQELQHNRDVDSYNQRVYEWQLFNSKIIFWLVVFLVLSGVALSGFQFYKDHRAQVRYHELTNRIANAAESAQPQDAKDSMSIEASLKGIKFNSNIIGMMILIISFLFFFAYLQFVYPIH
jgi:hypothetical protein